jgi:hypothetical protein
VKEEDETRLAQTSTVCIGKFSWCSVEEEIEWKAWRKRDEAEIYLVCIRITVSFVISVASLIMPEM